MPHRRMTFSKFIVEHRRRSTEPDPELIALLDEVQRSLSWYDNEWIFSNRMAATAVAIGKVV